MKAQRRHELKESDLGHTLEVARKYLDENSKSIGIVVIIVAAVVAAVAFGVRSRAAAIEDVWRRRGQLSFENPEIGKESLESLATMTLGVSDEQFVLTSLLEQGQQALRLAQEVAVPPDREMNNKARQAFEELLGRFQDNPLAVGVAHIGLATVEENEFMLDDELVHKERANAHLTAVIDDPALNGMPFKQMALDRRKALDETFTRVVFEYPQPEEFAETITVDEDAQVEYVEPVGADVPAGTVFTVPRTSVNESSQADDSKTSVPEAEDSSSTKSDPEKPGGPGSEPDDTP